MLIQFSVKNFLSFKDLVTFDMTATSIKEFENENIINVNDIKLLKSAVVYGANSSGKSNFIMAMEEMKNMVLNSVNDETAILVPTSLYFRLDKISKTKPISFEIVFIIENKKYIYGFEILKEEITKEYLYESSLDSKKPNKTKKIFTRSKEKKQKEYEYSFNVELGKGVKDLALKTRNNSLFLTVAAQFNNEMAMKILNWFRTSLLNYEHYNIKNTAEQILNNDNFKLKLLNFLKKIDVSIIDIVVEEIKMNYPNSIPAEQINVLSKRKHFNISTVHQVYDKSGKVIDKHLLPIRLESAGTGKLLTILLPIINILEKGGILSIDELDRSLHPLITKLIVKYFNSLQNTKGQLIFTTHDTNLLSSKTFRRDQIWFTEKNRMESTELYSLSEFKVRNDASYEKDYILGKYGAIPFISSNIEDFYND